jgi:hypothetical protein
VWRELIAITKFIVRWRVEPAEQALQSLAEETRDRRIQKHLVAFDLGMLHLQRSVFAMVVSLAHALEQLGVQRKAAAVSIQLYLTSVYTSLIAAVRSRIDTFLMAIASAVIGAAALGSLMSIFAPEGLLFFSIAAVASVVLTPIIASYVPEPGPYPLRLSALMLAGAVAGALLGGVKGYLLGVAAGAVPQTVVWLRYWRRYEKEIARIDQVIEGAKEDIAAGRTHMAQIAKEVYEHVKAVGSYDLEVQTRELLLYNARYLSEVRAIAKERALTIAVLFIAAVLVAKVVVATIFSTAALKQLEKVQAPPGVELPKFEEPDLTLLGWFVPPVAILVGRMFDSFAAVAPFALAMSLAAFLII